VAEFLFFPTGSHSPLALSLPLGSGSVSWATGSVAALVAVVVLLTAPLVSEAGSGGHGTSAGLSP
jgi:hypothetical protein